MYKLEDIPPETVLKVLFSHEGREEKKKKKRISPLLFQCCRGQLE